MDNELRKQVAAWLSANGLDPNDVPAYGTVTVADGQITTEVFVRNERGKLVCEPGDPMRPAHRTVQAPLLVEPNAAVAEWLRPRCPTCGR